MRTPFRQTGTLGRQTMDSLQTGRDILLTEIIISIELTGKAAAGAVEHCGKLTQKAGLWVSMLEGCGQPPLSTCFQRTYPWLCVSFPRFPWPLLRQCVDVVFFRRSSHYLHGTVLMDHCHKGLSSHSGNPAQDIPTSSLHTLKPAGQSDPVFS